MKKKNINTHQSGAVPNKEKERAYGHFEQAFEIFGLGPDDYDKIDLHELRLLFVSAAEVIIVAAEDKDMEYWERAWVVLKNVIYQLRLIGCPATLHFSVVYSLIGDCPETIALLKITSMILFEMARPGNRRKKQILHPDTTLVNRN